MANPQIVERLAEILAECVDRFGDTMAEVKNELNDRGVTFDVVLGGEGEGWWTRFEGYRPDAEELDAAEQIALGWQAQAVTA